MKRALSLLLACAMVMSLCACSGIYEKEYTVVEDYVPAEPQAQPESDKVTVRNFAALRQAVQNMVNAGNSEGSIIFDESYEGEPTADMANACWQVRTQNALCAYCVENISYEMSTVMTNEQAQVSISYGDTAVGVSDIIRKPYATGLDLSLRETTAEGRENMVLLISYSTYTAAGMESLLTRLYRQDPMMSPREPRFSVSMYSGTGMQRLYDISINYNLSSAERAARLSQLEKLELIAELDVRRMTEAEQAAELVKIMAEHCSYEADGGSSVYDALVLHQANSEGLALGLVALARELELDCEAVYGQRNWQDHCWNIIEIEGSRYHVDISACAEHGTDWDYLRNDQQMWADYRWDTSAYEPT